MFHRLNFCSVEGQPGDSRRVITINGANANISLNNTTVTDVDYALQGGHLGFPSGDDPPSYPRPVRI